MAASRFPGKPLAKIAGIPMIAHVHARCQAAQALDVTVIATCDRAIIDSAKCFGAGAVMTSDTHRTAIDRAAEALTSAESLQGRVFSHVVVAQGDEPFVHPETLESLVRALQDDDCDFVNIMTRIRTEAEFADPGNVKVICNGAGDATYMSREPIPSRWRGWHADLAYKQTGLIGFRRDALLWFASTPRGAVEDAESVDMLRAIHNGRSVRMVLSERSLLGVDTPDDLEAAELLMAEDEYFRHYAPLLADLQ